MSFATPVLLKSWDINSNIVVIGDLTAVGQTATDRRELLFKIKDNLVNGGLTVGWTVSQSSNGTVANSSDNWTDPTDLVFAQTGIDPNTSVRSWIVLNNSAMGINMLIDCTQGGTNRRGAELDIFLTESAYLLNGTISSKPTTLGTEHRLVNRTVADERYWGAGTTTSADRTFVMNLWQSTDGKHLRIVATNSQDGQNMFWCIGQLENAEGPPTHLWYASFNLNSSTASKTATSITEHSTLTQDPFLLANQSNSLVRARLTAPRLMGQGGWGDVNAIGASSRSYDGKIVFPEMGIYCQDASFRALWDKVPDVWWGLTGQNYEAKPWPSSTRTFCQFGDIVLPWDGSIPIQVL